MLTTRIRPKMSVKPLATTKNSADKREPVERDDHELVEVVEALHEQPADHGAGRGHAHQARKALSSLQGLRGRIGCSGFSSP